MNESAQRESLERKWYRLHASTWVVVLLTIGIVALLNLPGRRVMVEFGPLLETSGVEHGWPWPYLTRASMGYSGRMPLWSWTDNVHAVHRAGFFADVAVGLGLIVLVAALFEAWRRRRQRLLQISLLEMLVLLLVVAVPAAWIGYLHRRMNAQRATIERLSEDDPYGMLGWTWTSHLPDWLAEWLEESQPLLAEVHLLSANGQPGKAALEALEVFPGLKVLELRGSDIQDGDLRRLEAVPRLQWLDLSRTPVTDQGLPHLQRLSNLKILDLSGTEVTDKGMRHLAEIKTLRDLNLSNTQVTDEGVSYLQQALPEIAISDD